MTLKQLFFWMKYTYIVSTDLLVAGTFFIWLYSYIKLSEDSHYEKVQVSWELINLYCSLWHPSKTTWGKSATASHA